MIEIEEELQRVEKSRMACELANTILLRAHEAGREKEYIGMHVSSLEERISDLAALSAALQAALRQLA